MGHMGLKYLYSDKDRNGNTRLRYRGRNHSCTISALPSGKDVIENYKAARLKDMDKEEKITVYFPPRKVSNMLSRAKRRCDGREWEFNLTSKDIRDMIHDQGGVCALSGLPFFFEPEVDDSRNPYAPSIDRINCEQGYTRENVRLVLCAVNIGRSDWSDETYRFICGNVASNKNAK